MIDRTSHLELEQHERPFLDSNELIINMGPQHPATHGVLRVILKLDGEKVLGTECVIGYLHRGVEKIAEHRTYTMFNPYVDRMDYVAAVSNGLGYCEAVEKLLNVEAPPRARYIRVILTELNRLASHMLWLGTHALDIGAITPLFYTFRDREEILKIFEKYCGARLTTHAFRIGGCVYETYEGFEREVKKFLDFVAPKLGEYEELLTTNRIWVERTKDVGKMGSAQSSAVRGLRRLRFRYSRGRERRHLRPVHGAHAGDATIAANYRAGDRQDSRWPHHGQSRESHEASRG